MANNNKKKTRAKPKAPLIHERISQIMVEMPAIAKDSENVSQHFMYRSIDAIISVVHELLAKHNVFYVPKVVEKQREIVDRIRDGKVVGRTVIVSLDVEYKFICSEDRSEIVVGPITSEAADFGDKASPKAMTMALKTMLLQLFCIPVLNAYDPDGNGPGAPGAATKSKSRAKDLLGPGNGNSNQDIEAKRKFKAICGELSGVDFEKEQLHALCLEAMTKANTKDIDKAADWLKENATIELGEIGEPIIMELP